MPKPLIFHREKACWRMLTLCWRAINMCWRPLAIGIGVLGVLGYPKTTPNMPKPLEILRGNACWRMLSYVDGPFNIMSTLRIMLNHVDQHCQHGNLCWIVLTTRFNMGNPCWNMNLNIMDLYDSGTLNHCAQWFKPRDPLCWSTCFNIDFPCWRARQQDLNMNFHVDGPVNMISTWNFTLKGPSTWSQHECSCWRARQRNLNMRQHAQKHWNSIGWCMLRNVNMHRCWRCWDYVEDLQHDLNIMLRALNMISTSPTCPKTLIFLRKKACWRTLTLCRRVINIWWRSFGIGLGILGVPCRVPQAS